MFAMTDRYFNYSHEKENYQKTPNIRGEEVDKIGNYKKRLAKMRKNLCRFASFLSFVEMADEEDIDEDHDSTEEICKFISKS